MFVFLLSSCLVKDVICNLDNHIGADTRTKELLYILNMYVLIWTKKNGFVLLAMALFLHVGLN